MGACNNDTRNKNTSTNIWVLSIKFYEKGPGIHRKIADDPSWSEINKHVSRTTYPGSSVEECPNKMEVNEKSENIC